MAKRTSAQRLAGRRKSLRRPKNPKTPIEAILKTEARVRAANSAGRAGVKESRIGRPPHTSRRGWRELRRMGVRSPGYKAVKTHSRFVKRFANEVAKRWNQNAVSKGRVRGAKVDRGLVNQAALTHDFRRDFTEQDKQAQFYAAQLGATRLARILGTGDSWTPKTRRIWSLEKNIVALSDTVCRGIKVGNNFVNGIVPMEKAFKLLVSQRFLNPANVDALVLERLAQVEFAAQLKKAGVNIDSIIKEQMVHNPKAFMPAVNAQIKHVSELMLAEKIAQSLLKLGLEDEYKKLVPPDSSLGRRLDRELRTIRLEKKRR